MKDDYLTRVERSRNRLALVIAERVPPDEQLAQCILTVVLWTMLMGDIAMYNAVLLGSMLHEVWYD